MPGNYMDVKPDMELDISKRLPFPDDYADEVHSYHVIEHFYRWDIDLILREWRRVLKPGGVMVIECPSFDKIRWMLLSPRGRDVSLAMLGLYGAQEFGTPESVHKWCYSAYELEGILWGVGFDKVKRLEAKTHRPERDMRFEAMK
jgi:ubiquinone/menaquinone biosynthesis C-methylase UbiE